MNKLGAYCRSNKQLYAWTCSRRRRRDRRRGGLIMSEIHGCPKTKIGHVIDISQYFLVSFSPFGPFPLCDQYSLLR